MNGRQYTRREPQGKIVDPAILEAARQIVLGMRDADARAAEATAGDVALQMTRMGLGSRAYFKTQLRQIIIQAS